MPLQRELPLNLSEDDLPVWMQRARREPDWALLVAMVLCLVVIWPLLVRTGLPRNVGTQLELGHAIEMAESMQAGVAYPRWASDLNYGYGSPLWNYLAPLPHYVTGLFYVLLQTKPELSVKLVIALGIGLAGLGTFGFVRRRWGDYAALLATAIYLYSPQLVLVKPYLEGDLGGLLAMGFFSITLWTFDRVMVMGRGWDITLAAFTLAALVLAHTPLNILLVCVVLGWIGWCRLASALRGDYWQRALLAMVAGIGLCAFYWLPAWLERHEARWTTMTSYPEELRRVLATGAVLGQPDRLDLSAINPAPTTAIGVPVWGLAVLAVGLVGGWYWQREPAVGWRRIRRVLQRASAAHWEAIYFGGVGIFSFVLVSPVGRTFWRDVPDWPVIYPHDLLPLIAVCGALVAAQIGVVVERMAQPGWGMAMMIGCLVAVLVSALTLLYPPMWPERRQSTPDVTTLLRDDKTRGYAIASLMTNWVVPQAVEDVPRPSPSLIASYRSDMIDKIVRDTLPAAVTVDVISHSPKAERLVVKAAQPATLTLYTFYFPGWRAEINSRQVPIEPDPNTGFITLMLPKGQHEVLIYFGSTPPRTVGWVISGMVVLVLIGVGFRVQVGQSVGVDQEVVTVGQPRTMQHVMYLVVILLFGVGGSVTRLMPEWFTLRSSPGTVTAAEQPFPRVVLQGGVDLLAYDLDAPDIIYAGDTVRLVLYWRAVQPGLPDYQTNVSVVSRNDPTWMVEFAQHRHPGRLPSSQWPVWPLMDYYVRDVYHLTLDKNAPTGEYNIVIQIGECNQLSLRACETIVPLFVGDARGGSLGQRIVLPTVIEVEP